MALIKLQKQEVLALQPDDITPYHVRLTRLYWPEPKIIYEGPARLHIQRAPASKKLPERLCCITTKGIDWAEGSWNDVFEDGAIVVEDYQLEIFSNHSTL